MTLRVQQQKWKYKTFVDRNLSLVQIINTDKNFTKEKSDKHGLIQRNDNDIEFKMT